MPRTVAIWGSCVTRDAFPAPDQTAQEDRDGLSLLYYGARSSWVSQDSAPWTGQTPGLESMPSGFGRRLVQEDLNKTIVDRLVEHQPDLLVLDLIDERLPIVRVGETWLTVSDYLNQTGITEFAHSRADEVVKVTDSKREQLFAGAALRLSRRLMGELPKTTFVLNEAPYTTLVKGGARMGDPQARWARELQSAQEPMVGALMRAFGRRLVRATPPPSVCVADPDHKWGLTSYHYVEDYYGWLVRELLSSSAGEMADAGGPLPRWLPLRGTLSGIHRGGKR